MAMTPEARVKKAIREILKELGAYYSMPIGSGYGASTGTPDFLICLSGLFIGVEAKAGKNKPTALQEKNLKQIQEAGGYAIVVNEENLPELKTLLLKQMKNKWIPGAD